MEYLPPYLQVLSSRLVALAAIGQQSGVWVLEPIDMIKCVRWFKLPSPSSAVAWDVVALHVESIQELFHIHGF